MPKQAKRLAEYFALIIERTVKSAPINGNNIGIRCRRRPKRRPCTGVLKSEMQQIDETDKEEIEWLTTKGDGASGGQLPDTTTEVLTGHIRWDEEKSEPDRSLPRIETANKEYTWEVLGEKVLEYEGRRIKIEVF